MLNRNFHTASGLEHPLLPEHGTDLVHDLVSTLVIYRTISALPLRSRLSVWKEDLQHILKNSNELGVRAIGYD